MQYVCDAPQGTWFRIETEFEAAEESRLMEHAVEKFFRKALAEASRSYSPPTELSRIEQNIGLKAFIAKTMPRFLTLRSGDGTGLVTAMLPPAGRERSNFRCIIVGQDNADPYVDYEASIAALANHFQLALDRDRCFPYAR